MYRQIHKFLRDALVKSSCFLFVYLFTYGYVTIRVYSVWYIIDTTIRDLGQFQLLFDGFRIGS